MYVDSPSYKRRLDELSRLIEPYAYLWQRSLLQDPSPLTCPASWLEALRTLDEDALRSFDNEAPLRDAPEDLLRLHEDLAALCQLPEASDDLLPQTPPVLGISAKKCHEIARITHFLRREGPQNAWQEIIDVGGGQGHLARALVSSTALPVLSIDQQAQLQASGKKRQDEGDPRLRFHLATVGVDELGPMFHERALSLGLHTCGDLAWHHLELSLRSASLLNFGCCYDKLSAAGQQQSALRTRHFPLSPAALFLATRGRKDKSFAQFRLQKRAQSYRFGLHLLLLGEGQGFAPMGHAPQELYAGSFLAYARDRLQRLPHAPRLADAAIEDFFASPASQEQVRDLWLLDLLRNRFSRPLEIMILCDRALWLSQQSWQVALLNFFDRGLSPRSVGIYARPLRSSY